METKPYRIQSPEAIAKDYGGNKQQIAQAMQMGIVDPTAGVLAGMFIDRMRSAQMQEMAPKPTVAQQVMGGAPAQAPLAPAGGLGATAPAMPPMAPAMGVAPMAPEPPEPSMAEAPVQSLAAGGEFEPPYMGGGGLSEIPIPDTMFDEDRNGGYADGGLIAFAKGDEVRSRFAKSIIAQESGGNYKAINKGSGARGKYQLMPPTARALAARLGLEYRPELLTADTPEAREYQDKLGEAAISEAWDYGKGDVGLAAKYYFAGPDQKKWGKKTEGYRSDILSRMGQPELKEQDTEAPEGRRRTLEDQMKVARDLFGDLPDSGFDEAEEYYRKQLSPEEKEKDRKYDMWQTLAQIGASMASTKSPQFLQAAGQAMAEALPGAAASKKERDKAERDAVSAIMEIGRLRRGEAKEVLEFGKGLYAAEMGAEEAETEREFRRQQEEDKQEFTEEQNRLGRESSERIAAETARSRNTTFEIAYQNRYEQLKQRIKQGVPIIDPVSKKRIPANASDAELRVLAQRLARMDTANAAAAQSAPYGLPNPAGEGAEQDQGQYLGTIGG